MRREKIDLTDRELYFLALSIQSHLNSRDTYFTKTDKIIYNKLINKLVEIGLNRKNPPAILHPIMKFEE